MNARAALLALVAALARPDVARAAPSSTQGPGAPPTASAAASDELAARDRMLAEWRELLALDLAAGLLRGAEPRIAAGAPFGPVHTPPTFGTPFNWVNKLNEEAEVQVCILALIPALGLWTTDTVTATKAGMHGATATTVYE